MFGAMETVKYLEISIFRGWDESLPDPPILYLLGAVNNLARPLGRPFCLRRSREEARVELLERGFKARVRFRYFQQPRADLKHKMMRLWIRLNRMSHTLQASVASMASCTR